MSTNGQLVFTDVDKITFKGVGNTSNAVVDTVTGKIGVGIDNPDANLHVLGNSYVSTNLELGGTLIMGTVNVEAYHSLEAVTATGNTTPLTVEFSNATTGIVTTGNVEVGNELTVAGNVTVSSNLIVSGNATVSSNLTVSENVEVAKELTVSGNVAVNGINIYGEPKGSNQFDTPGLVIGETWTRDLGFSTMNGNSDYYYIGCFKFNSAVELEVTDYGNSLYSTSKYTVTRHYGNAPQVTGHKGTYYVQHRFYYSNGNDVNLDYHLWLLPYYGYVQSGEYRVRYRTGNVLDQAENTSGRTECVYGLISGHYGNRVGVAVRDPDFQFQVIGKHGLDEDGYWARYRVGTSHPNGTTRIYFRDFSGSDNVVMAVNHLSSANDASDDRIKTDEVLVENATQTLLKLKPQTYTKDIFEFDELTSEEYSNTETLTDGYVFSPTHDRWRKRRFAGRPRKETGLIIQDIWYDAPELRHIIRLADDAEPTEERPETEDIQQDPDYDSLGWGQDASHLMYQQIIPYLIKSNQELHARIQALENAS